jgi:hypothetical protein
MPPSNLSLFQARDNKRTLLQEKVQLERKIADVEEGATAFANATESLRKPGQKLALVCLFTAYNNSIFRNFPSN